MRCSQDPASPYCPFSEQCLREYLSFSIWPLTPPKRVSDLAAILGLLGPSRVSPRGMWRCPRRQPAAKTQLHGQPLETEDCYSWALKTNSVAVRKGTPQRPGPSAVEKAGPLPPHSILRCACEGIQIHCAYRQRRWQNPGGCSSMGDAKRLRWAGLQWRG